MTAPTWHIEKPSPPDDRLPTPAAADARPLQEPQPSTPQQDLQVDAAADRAAFEELLAFIAANKDEGTVVTHLSVDEFMTGLVEPASDSIPTTTIEEIQS